MKKLLIILLILLFTLLLKGTAVYDLPDLLAPHAITVKNTTIFISAKSKVYKYQYPDVLKTVFGKKGEGPGEFREYFDMGLLVSLLKDNIVVSSNGKVSFFRPEGTFIREVKTGRGHTYVPVKDRFVGIKFSMEDNLAYNVIVLTDENFKTVKILQKKLHWYQQGKKIDPVNVRNPRFCVMGDLAYAENPNGTIHIYNTEGEEVGQAKSEYQKVPVSALDQQQYHDYYRNHIYYKQRYHELKSIIKFPKFYSPVKFFDCANGQIYVLTHFRQGDSNEMYIYNNKGKLLKKIMIKMPDLIPQEVFPLIRIAGHKIYQLLEDPDEETWQLHVTDIPEL